MSNDCSSIAKLRQQLIDFPRLRNDCPDEFLKPFLRSVDEDHAAAALLIDKYATARISYPKLFGHLGPGVMNIFEDNIITYLPKLSTGELVIITRSGAWNPSRATLSDLFGAGIAIIEYLTATEYIDGDEVILVYDKSGFGWQQLKGVASNPLAPVGMFDITMNHLPIKFKKTFLVNETIPTSMAYNLVKNFFSKEMQERIKFIGTDYDQLHEYVPPALLPDALGGTAEQFDNSAVFKDFLANTDKLLAYWNKYQQNKD